jgi:hypothetical protein
MKGGREGGGEGVEMFLWVSGGIQREQLIIEKERKKERKKAPVFCFIYGFATASSSFSIALLFIFFLPLEGEIW